jgi:4a-hydroxytetrahydrobiopterin dehydratase
MSTPTAEQLASKQCLPCEGGIPVLSRAQAEVLRAGTPAWTITADGQRIRREWIVKNFMAAVSFFNQVARIAEAEGHHPDLHLVGYRNVAIELWTHAIGGLSENDFILAAKIDTVPVALKSS